MEHEFFSPSLTVALAMLAGSISMTMAKHLRLPSIILLLGVGVLLGPDFANVVRPGPLGKALQLLVGFAAAIILFEGGMALRLSRLRRAQRAVRQLVTVGAVVTLGGAMAVSYYFMGWGLRMSFLFGTLVVVTGPTVIGPLLKRLNVEHDVATVLEAEGVLIDAVGAITATVALEVMLQPSTVGMVVGGVDLVTRLGFGAAIGLAAGFVLSTILRFRHIVPDELENIFVLAYVLALFQFSNAVLHESGIAAVTLAGMVVGARPAINHRLLHTFKEQLTSFFIGTLFILLAADVRMSEIQALGMGGVFTVLALIFFVRPLNVAVGTFGSQLNWKQRLFIGWIGPRGIIAAAVASLFAVRLDEQGLEGGSQLRAMVFSTIAATVFLAGLTGGPLAKILGLARKKNSGWVLLGANPLALKLAKSLSESDGEVVCIDSDPGHVTAAEKAGIRTIFGNALEPRTLKRAELDTRRGVIAVSESEEANYLFIQMAMEQAKIKDALVVLHSLNDNVTEKMVTDMNAEVCFGSAQNLTVWNARERQQQVEYQQWQITAEVLDAFESGDALFDEIAKNGCSLPLVIRRKKSVLPLGHKFQIQAKDRLDVLVHDAKSITEAERLKQMHLKRLDNPYGGARSLTAFPSVALGWLSGRTKRS